MQVYAPESWGWGLRYARNTPGSICQYKEDGLGLARLRSFISSVILPSSLSYVPCTVLKFRALDRFPGRNVPSRAAGSRKRLYLRRRYIPQGRKNPMLSVINYICVGYHPGGCRFSKWCNFFFWAQKVKGGPKGSNLILPSLFWNTVYHGGGRCLPLAWEIQK